MKPSELSFKTLCIFFEAVAKAPPRVKVLLLRRLLEKNLERDSDDLYEAFRLMLPYVGLAAREYWSIHSASKPPIPSYGRPTHLCLRVEG